METIPKSTNQINPSNENRSPFPPFGNIFAYCMATLSLPRFTIGLPVWLFSTSLVPNVQIDSQPSSPPSEQYQPQVDTKVDPLPSSHFVSSYLSSSSHGESIDYSNQEAKKKNKGMNKKK